MKINQLYFKLSMMQDIANLLFHDKKEKRDRWMEIFKDPVWKPIYNAPLHHHRDLAYKQLKKVMDSNIVSVYDFVNDPTNIFTAHQMVGSVSGSTCTKFTVHINLFGGSIMALHTERHKDIFEKINKLEITGCFCLTQLGYGNNAVKMQTTATYDEKTKQFIINSPTTLSQKYWITNGAIHANYALVFAQTIVKNKNQGVNAFLVPIRDLNRNKVDKVDIWDMGMKIGLNGVDNAALQFHDVRIPRQNMMNKYCDVTQNGQFISNIKGIQQRFFKVTQRLLSGRLCIASMTLGSLKTMTYATIKYAQQRKSVSPNGNSQTPIIDYQLQKNALIPLVARTLGLNMLHNFAKATFANPIGMQNQVLMICCVDKTLMGWHAERAITIMRERCGGQGFLSANMLGQALMGSHAAMTAEGDNRVLMIKVVKDMLNIFKKNPDAFYNGQWIKITKTEDLYDLQILQQLFQMRQRRLLDNLIGRMLTLKSQGMSNYDILMKNVSDEVQDLAQAYGQRLAIQSCVRSLEKLTKGKETMRKYFTIFAWDIIFREMSSLLLQDMICPVLAKSLKLKYNELIKQASQSLDIVIQSMNVPICAVYIPIAKNYVLYNEKNYGGEITHAKM